MLFRQKSFTIQAINLAESSRLPWNLSPLATANLESIPMTTTSRKQYKLRSIGFRHSISSSCQLYPLNTSRLVPCTYKIHDISKLLLNKTIHNFDYSVLISQHMQHHVGLISLKINHHAFKYYLADFHSFGKRLKMQIRIPCLVETAQHVNYRSFFDKRRWVVLVCMCGLLDKNKIIDLLQDCIYTMYKCLFTRIIASNKWKVLPVELTNAWRSSSHWLRYHIISHINYSFNHVRYWKKTWTHCGLVSWSRVWHTSGPTLAQVMGLMAPNKYLNQCWLII